VDDIVIRLQEMLDGPVPFSVSRQDIRDALLEIERLRAIGDRLFMHADSHYGIGNPYPDWVKRDLDTWQEARRG
jgi:hypothetical protein